LRAAQIIAKAKVTQKAQQRHSPMAETESRTAGHPAMDYAEHERTYRMFLKLIKYTVVGTAAILALLAFLWG
jgi:hypothetical protein